MRFDARTLAAGWLTVALASADDKDRPILHRTILIEQHNTGLRLVATDSYKLLHTWVPYIDDVASLAPDLDEAPIAEMIAVDPDRRCRALMAYLFASAGDPDDDDYEVTEASVRFLSGAALVADRISTDFDHTVSIETTGQFPGMESTRIIVEKPGQEKLTLNTIDAPFPHWRTMTTGALVKTDRVALNPTHLADIAKVKTWHPGSTWLWSFGGSDKPAHLELHGSTPLIQGLICPSRWPWAGDPA